MKSIRILGIQLTEQISNADQFQSLLTQYGNIIRTRLGLNEANDDYSNAKGIIILELVGEVSQFDVLESKLSEIDGIRVQSMNFL